MNIAEFSIRNRTSTLVVTALLVIGGLYSYQRLGRLEDPEFTIKDALIVTPYPGATAEEVENEVSDLIERAVQQLGQLKEVESRSQKGLSTVTATIKDKYDKEKLPQVWDELRRKVGDVQSQLPPGAGPSKVVDDFGDVFGVFFALTGDGYSAAELEDVAEYLQRELLLVRDVAKVDLVGVVPERIYVEMSRDKMTQFGVPKGSIYRALSDKNLVANSGNVRVGREYVQLRPTGEFETVEEISELLISTNLQPGAVGGAQGRLVRLGDIATVSRGYKDPPSSLMRVDGKPAVGLAISTVPGGNVVTMGVALLERLQELRPTIPFGIEFHRIAVQSESVAVAISSFVTSLMQAIVIVIAVLMIFMGLRSGVLIGLILFITICGTFLIMDRQGIMLERISLGSLIIALGMLVDNAIVVTEGMLIRIQRGEDKLEAAKAVVSQNSIPLLGATVVAVLAFAAIGTSQDNTGEYCRSLFQVILISLMLSWLTAVTITPLFCTMAFNPEEGGKTSEAEKNPYAGVAYQLYKRLLILSIRFRWIVGGSMIALLVAAIIGFGFVEQSFFPSSTRPQFMIDFWLPEGTHIDDTAKEAGKAEEYLRTIEGVTSIATFIGRGAPRFLLTYAPEKTDSSYTYFMVSVDDYHKIDSIMEQIQADLEDGFPEAIPLAYKFMLGPGDPYKIQARITGPDRGILRDFSTRVMGVMNNDGGLMGIQTDWRTMVKDLRPTLAEIPARKNGIERPAIASALQEAFDGTPVGLFRDGDTLLPIVSRAPKAERDDVAQIQNLQIWSPTAGRNIPISQVLVGFETVFDDPIIIRRDRRRTITIKCNPRGELASKALARIQPKVEAIAKDLPPGYEFEWGGEYENSRDAQAALASSIPVFVLMMVIVVIFLFNAFRQPLIIWMCVPLALIGVTAGLLVARQPFGFMPLLGLLSLMGMLIKNAIVLIDQIDLEIREGKDPYWAIVDSGVSRMRPVLMAASTTVLGMIPLLFDAFFVSMAVTIMAGLTFASILTLIVVPMLYAIFFRATQPA